MENNFITFFADILEMDANDIKLQDKFREYEKWDSLVYLSVIVMMDEEFGVQIETNDFNKLVSVEDLIRAVTKN